MNHHSDELKEGICGATTQIMDCANGCFPRELENEGVMECIENQRLRQGACGSELAHDLNRGMDAGSGRKRVAKGKKSRGLEHRG